MIRKLILTLTMFCISALILFITISCDKKEDFVPQLELEVTTVSLASALNSTGTINITSNTNWTASSSASWLKVEPAEGTSNGVATVTAEENADTTIRTAIVTVSVENLNPVEVMVSQNGSQYDLTVSETKLDFEAQEQTAIFSIVSNTSWSITGSESWLTFSPAEGSNNGTVNVTAESNTVSTERTALIVVTGDKTASHTIEVMQSGMEYKLAFSTKAVVVEPESANTTFEIITNVDWKIDFEEEWLTVSPTSGKGTTTILVNVESNPVGSERFSRLWIDTDHFNRQVVRVTQSGIPCKASDEVSTEMGVCNINVPTYASLPSNPFLPDPFLFMSGTRMTSKSEWECRRAEIAVLAQELEYGIKPHTPYEATTGTLNGNTLSVTVSDNGKTISFDCPISYPTVGTAPYPAVISLGFSMVNTELLSMGVAVITLPNDAIAEQTNSASRGKGKFYDFYCNNHSAGALIAWSWGASRLIDALEKTPNTNINHERLGVTGCSRNGKGALAIGAFDDRIDLTIPFESGSGGSASWRVSDFQGSSVQRLQQIVGENCWFRANLSQFSNTANKLPFDHHMIMGLCAPRGLLVIENPWQTWLGNLSTWTTGNAAHKIWEALGVPENMGFTQVGNSGHCFYAFSDIVKEALNNSVQKFLFDNQFIDTHIMYTDGELEFDEEKWIDWTVPDLN